MKDKDWWRVGESLKRTKDEYVWGGVNNLKIDVARN